MLSFSFLLLTLFLFLSLSCYEMLLITVSGIYRTTVTCTAVANAVTIAIAYPNVFKYVDIDVMKDLRG